VQDLLNKEILKLAKIQVLNAFGLTWKQEMDAELQKAHVLHALSKFTIRILLKKICVLWKKRMTLKEALKQKQAIHLNQSQLSEDKAPTIINNNLNKIHLMYNKICKDTTHNKEWASKNHLEECQSNHLFLHINHIPNKHLFQLIINITHRTFSDKYESIE